MGYIDIRVPDLANYKVKYYMNNTDIILHPRIWPLHLHDQLEIYILIEGDVSFVVESSLYKLSAGDAVVIAPNERHHCVLNTTSHHRHLCFWFDPSCHSLLSDFIDRKKGTGNLISPDSKSKARLGEIFRDLDIADRSNDTHMQLYLTIEMLHILRKNISKTDCIQQLPDILKTILSDIDESFKSIQSLDYFTEKYFISESTLNRLFNAYLHTTPKKYVQAKKLAHSRYLLKNGSTVLSACMESGFSDYSNYIRLFKKRFSITPSQYRNGERPIGNDNGYEN